jgi:alkaline phosphatase D
MNSFLNPFSFRSTAVLLTLAAAISISAAESGPRMATGFKIGEVTDTTAIIWTRLTERKAANPADGPMIEIIYEKGNGGRRRQPLKAVNYPPGATVRTIRSAAPGRNGEVRLHYRPEGEAAFQSSDWLRVDPAADFTRQFTIRNLRPNTHYRLRVQERDKEGATSPSHGGGFWTGPSSDAPEKVVFTVSTGQAFGDQDRPDGFQIYPSMQKLRPNFFVHTGDIVYYDKLAKNRDLANYHWQRTYSLPTNVKFHRNVSSYFIKDDHDTWVNDCWPTMKSPYMGDLTFEQGLKIFQQQVPMGNSTYRTRRWGKDLQIWMVEGRDFRSANTDPDGPSKTIWGKKQKEWFKRTVRESDAAFRVLISPTPIVGPDRDSKHDNHSNKGFRHEGDEIRTFLASQKNMIVICGDRHWQYHSIHPTTKVREYSCGPASDKHAGGWKKDDFRADYHQYLNVIGGFLSVTAERRKEGKPTLAMRFHDVNGKVNYEDILTGE